MAKTTAGVDTYAEVSLLDSRLFSKICSSIKTKKIPNIVGIDNRIVESLGAVEVEIVSEERSFKLEFVVIDNLEETVHVPVLLGVDAHKSLGGFTLRFDGETPQVRYGASLVAAVKKDGWIEDTDGWYKRRDDGSWEFRWRWVREPLELIWNGVYMYDRKLKTKESQDMLAEEMKIWLEKGFIIPYNESSMGSVGAILPINPVLQPGKTTAVRPTLDYTNLNQYITSTSDRDHNEVCAESLRKWRRYTGLIVADLSKAYMRVHISPELWKYQTIQWKGENYALTRLGFGLSSAPRALKIILDQVLEGHKVDLYRDDLCVGANSVEERRTARKRLSDALRALEIAGFPSKEPVEVFAGELTQPVNVLGLQVFAGEKGELQWRRKSPLIRPESIKTLREIAGVVGRFAPGNLPVLRWARPYAQLLRSMIGREAGTEWKAPPSAQLQELTTEFIGMMIGDDPAGGCWSTRPPDTNATTSHWTLCCDASQVALGAVLISGREIDPSRVVEDYCWMNTKPRQINVLEAEAVLKGLTEACKHAGPNDSVSIVVDSKTAHSWISKSINGDILRCKSLSGVLLTRRLSIIHDLAKQLGEVTIRWVPSEQNPADEMTRVKATWVTKWKSHLETETPQPSVVGAAMTGGINIHAQIKGWQNEFRGETTQAGGVMVNGMLCRKHGSRKGVYLPVIVAPFLRPYLERRHVELGHQGRVGLWKSVREEASFPEGKLAEEIANVLEACDVCNMRRPTQYESLSGTAWGRYPWEEVFMDCLTLPSETLKGVIIAICSFSRFVEAKPVESFSAKTVIEFLEELRPRFGQPKVLRVDHGREFDNFALKQWCDTHGTQQQFSSVANPRSQGVVERFNRTLLEILRSMMAVEVRPWQEVLTKAIAIYNGRGHTALNGNTPREVFLGRKEIRAAEQIEESDRDEPKEWIDLYRPLEMEHVDTFWDPKFEKGQEVHTRAQKPKDQLDWTPARVLEIGTNRAYTIETATGAVKVVHESNLKPRLSDMSQESSEEYHSSEEQPHVDSNEEPHVASSQKNFENDISGRNEISQPRDGNTEGTDLRRSKRKPKPMVRFDL